MILNSGHFHFGIIFLFIYFLLALYNRENIAFGSYWFFLQLLVLGSSWSENQVFSGWSVGVRVYETVISITQEQMRGPVFRIWQRKISSFHCKLLLSKFEQSLNRLRLQNIKCCEILTSIIFQKLETLSSYGVMIKGFQSHDF